VPDEVKRSYRSARRSEQAAATRAAVLRAAREHFTQQGYAATSVAGIAASARVNVDTVYRVVGRKPQLMLAVIDMALAGSDEPVVAEQRDYVQAVLAAEGARAKLTTYAEGLGRVMPRVAPLFDSLAQAALTEPDCAALRTSIGERRAGNMLKMATDLRATGDLRADLTDQEVADLLWTTNAPEYYSLAIARGWSPATYAARLADLWTRLLLEDAAGPRHQPGAGEGTRRGDRGRRQ
jgi:AcrR family transcriptional regulator